MSNIKPRGFYL
jgi:hypothetical protein